MFKVFDQGKMLCLQEKGKLVLHNNIKIVYNLIKMLLYKNKNNIVDI